MSTAVIMLALGLALTVKGGDLFVDAAVWFAESLGIPKFLIGATVVSLATTLPELAVSLQATARGSDGIAAGNAVGSVCANLGLILGITLCLTPTGLDRRDQGLKLAWMLLAGALLFSLCIGGQLGPVGVALMLGLCILHLWQSARAGREHLTSRGGRRTRPRAALLVGHAARFISGTAGIAAGSRLLSDYGALLARLCGVPEGVIGATLVAVGTSLPELVTALTALSRREGSLAIGNVVGANIIDLTLILPLCALTRGGSLPLPRQSLRLDMPFCLALCVIAVVPTLAHKRFRRCQGAALLGVFATYVARVIGGI